MPEVLTTDGGSTFMLSEATRFMDVWGITHRVSSAYHPHGNLWAELGVKTMKRLMQDNLGSGGSLETDSFARALLTYRNTPDRDTGRLPAQVVFGRVLRDFIPVKEGDYRLRKEWILTQQEWEKALARWHKASSKECARSAHALTPLALGTVVSVQN